MILNYLKQIRKLEIVFMISAILLFSNFCYAENTFVPISFKPEVAAKIVVELEQCRIETEILKTFQEQKEEHLKIINNLKLVNELYEDKLSIATNTIQEQERLFDIAEEICEQRVKDAKPTFLKEVGKSAIGVSIGIILGILLF